jgi:uncharacterized protein (DUF736 family)
MNHQIELCALWEKHDKNGNTYLSGRLGSAHLLVFPNSHKSKDSQPSHRVVLVERNLIKNETLAAQPGEFSSMEDEPPL